ncbi:subtilisin-like protein [Lactarius deliciosus]|nr:subtilisin-like protein [Lactarius deliciosus]
MPRPRYIAQVMRIYPLSVLSLLAPGPLSSLATPFASHWDDHRPKHTWNSVPENWKNLGHPPADTTIDLHIALKAQNENALIDALIEVSSPGHPRQGAHLSREEVAELVAPPSEVLELANAWLDHYGVHPSSVSTKHGGSWLTLTGVPISRANELLRASYQLYQHIGTNDTVLRTLSYGLPAALVEHVQNVAPTTHFGFPRTHRQDPLMRRDGATSEQTKVPGGDPGTVFSRRNQDVTPSFLRWLYKTSRYVPLATDRNMLGVAGYLGDSPSPDDLRQFMNQYRSDATSATYSVVKIKGGGYDPSNPTTEANLNMQYTSATAYPTPHIFYSTGNFDTQGDGFMYWLDYVLGMWRVPQTHMYAVCSRGSAFAASASSLRAATTVLVGGTAYFKTAPATRGSSSSPPSPPLVRIVFNSTFEQQTSVCRALTTLSTVLAGPWVTSVGGTTGYNPEVAASLSGGGFSAYFPRPPYQNNAVPTFLLNLGDQYSGFYNPGGRGIPDIALQAIDFRIIFKNQPWKLSGTSCSAPTAAGIISLLNDYRISIGRAPLGFLNVWLYGICLGGLNDITSGSNPGCNTDGFSAIPGWDPVTGLGSLDFERLVAILSRW